MNSITFKITMMTATNTIIINSIQQYFALLCTFLIDLWSVMFWGQKYITDRRSIEKAQRRATKLIHGLYDVLYLDCLVALNLPSLQYSRF